MVDEFDEMVNAGRRRWMAALIVNAVLLTMLGVAAAVLLTRSGVITAQSIVASRTSQISADQEGKIVKIFLEENEQFKEGQSLFRIENPDLLTQIEGINKIIEGYDKQIAEEQSNLSQFLQKSDLIDKKQSTEALIERKRIQLKNAQLDLDNATSQVAYAKAESEKAQVLFTSGAITRARVETYRIAYESKLDAQRKILGDIAVLQTDIEADKGTLLSYTKQLDAQTSLTAQRVSDLLEKKTTRKAELAKCESAKQRWLRKADRSGSVAIRRKEEGEMVKPGEAVLEVTTGEDLWVEAYFRSEDVPLVHPGDQPVVRYSNQPFPATVESIGLVTKPFPFQRASMMSAPENLVVVKLLFVQLDQAKKAGLRPGMQVTTELTRQEGLLYRLGLKQAKASAHEGARNEPTSKTRGRE